VASSNRPTAPDYTCRGRQARGEQESRSAPALFRTDFLHFPPVVPGRLTAVCRARLFPLAWGWVMKTLSKIVLTGLVLACGAVAPTAMAEWDQACVDLVLSENCIPAIAGVWGGCCFPEGICEEMESDDCTWDGGVTNAPLECSGDSDANGIDDACECDDFSTACCLPDETCSQMLPEMCEATGGWSIGWCGSSCPSVCPHPACLATEGDCAEPHGTPGCDHPNLCGCVCGVLPHCCEETSDVPATSHRGMIAGAVLLLVASAAFLLWRRRAAN
jgi:hypothetical protein